MEQTHRAPESHASPTERAESHALAVRHGERLAAALGGLPLGVVTCTTDGRVAHANDRFAQLLGHARGADVVGLDVYALTHPDDRALDYRHSAAVLAGAQDGYTIEKRYLAVDGSHVWVSLSASSVRAPDGRALCAYGIVQDIRAQKQAAAELERLQALTAGAHERALALQRVTAALSVAVTRGEIVDTVVAHGLEGFGAAAASITLLDPATGELVLAEPAILPPGAAESWRRFPATDLTPLGVAVSRGETVWIASREALRAAFPELVASYPPSVSEAVVAVPLRMGESGTARTLGALTLGFDAPRAPTAADRAYLETLARLAAQALERARLYEAELVARTAAERRQARTRRLQEVTAALARASTPQAVADALLAQAVPAVQAAAGLVLVAEAAPPAPYALRLLGARGYPADALPALGDVGWDSPLVVAEVCRTREPSWQSSPPPRRAGGRREGAPEPPADGSGEDPLLTGVFPAVRATRDAAALVSAARRGDDTAGANGMEETGGPDGRAFAATATFPLLVEGRLIGALGFAFVEPQAFTEGARASMLALADLTAQALERTRLFEAEQRARAAMEHASRAKSDFLAVMSHELRTPLQAVIGYADLLQLGVAGPVTEAQTQHLGRIRGSARHLVGLIEQILTFSRLEAGAERPELEAIDPGIVAHEAADMLRPLALARGLALDVTTPPPGTLRMHSDPQRLRQALVNLLTNAVKYTPAGRVALTVAPAAPTAPDAAATTHGAGLPRVAFTVADTGVGIAAEHQARVFEPFWQAAPALTREVGGTGLGLSVVRELAQVLGGTVHMASTPGVGSVFTLTLPERPPAPDGLGDPAPAPADAAGRLT